MTQCFLNCHLFLYNSSDQIVVIFVCLFFFFFKPHILGLCLLGLSSLLALASVILGSFGLFQTLLFDIFPPNVNMSTIFTASTWDKCLMGQTAGEM